MLFKTIHPVYNDDDNLRAVLWRPDIRMASPLDTLIPQHVSELLTTQTVAGRRGRGADRETSGTRKEIGRQRGHKRGRQKRKAVPRNDRLVRRRVVVIVQER